MTLAYVLAARTGNAAALAAKARAQREGLRVRGVTEIRPVEPGHWRVTLEVRA